MLNVGRMCDRNPCTLYLPLKEISILAVMMKKNISLVLAMVAWFAVVSQYYLMIENRVVSVSESTIRFFSYFTILTNTMVAVYCTWQLSGKKPLFISRPGTLTAVTVYILVVGLVYQVLLRHIWQPAGFQKITDELLHSVVPLLVLIYWYMYEEKPAGSYRQVFSWLVYPLAYLCYILVRGNFSGFYPYPFADVAALGMKKVLINSGMLLLFFLFLSALLIGAGKRLAKK